MKRTTWTNGGDGQHGIAVANVNAADFIEIIALDARITGFARADFWTNLFHHRETSETLCVLIAKSGGKMIGYALGEVRLWPVCAPAGG